MHVARFGCFVAAVLLLVVPVRGAEPSIRGTLHLAGGDSIDGELADALQPNVLRWHARGFATSFAFPIVSVHAIHFAVPDRQPAPAGDACLDLVGGDRLFGSLIALTAEHAEWDLAGGGPVRVRRESIRQLWRLRDASDLIYLGPHRLDEWEQSGFRQVEGGHLATDERGAFLNGDIGIPSRATIEFEVSWTRQPDFALAVGVDDSPKTLEHAFRFEVWDKHLVAVRETDDAADVTLLTEIPPASGSVRLQAYLDQVNDRMLVYTDEGERLADLAVPDGESQALSKLRLINRGGNLRLKRLRVTRWDGKPPPDVRTATSRIHRADGTIVYGNVATFHREDREFVIAGEDREVRAAWEDIAFIVLSPRGKTPPSSVCVDLHNGMRVSGELVKIEQGRLWLDSPAVTEPLAFAVAELRTILVANSALASPVADGRSGRLEWEGVRLHGALVAGHEADGVGCLVWRPRGSTTASPMLPGVTGRIVYREPPPPSNKRTANDDRSQRRRKTFLGTFLRALSGAAAEQPAVRAPASPQMLHLRSGDTIPCQVKRIDESGVAFETPLANATFVPHGKLKAVELAGVSNAVSLTGKKLKRLLTLPRIRRHNPPTHLIRSTNGDFLRARIQQMDDNVLTIEVRLEARQLQRGAVAQIIWLHEDEWKRADQDPPASKAPARTPVQALRSDGIRLTFFPKQLSNGKLAGESDVLGACHVEMEKVDQLLVGGAIERAAARLKFGRWRLYPATDPRFVTADDGQGARPPGTESALVGNPAPDFKLQLLDGETFRLSEQRGKVVVLDFWATWCGPCMDAMPQVDEVVQEFKHHDVQWIAVNLQERTRTITSALERLELTPTVALDIDGAVAAKYAATAIPETVIIDADGTVVRLFVGGGRELGGQLRDALEAVLGDKDAAADADP